MQQPNRRKFVKHALLTSLALSIALPAAAQETGSTPVAPAAQASAPAATLSQEQIVAFNKAVTDFTAGQQAQQKGDNATAVVKYEAALPAIRDAVKTQPDKIDNVNFLANALYAMAAANAALQKLDAVAPLYEESLPHWRQVVAANPADAQSRGVLTGILIQLGNFKLGKQDKAGAAPFYAEAIPLARKAVAEQSNPVNRNLLLASLIGASQTSEDAALKAEAATLSKAMVADGSVDAANKPSAQVLAQSAKAS
jgi:tetratricopeptide (TPR) repeat protein